MRWMGSTTTAVSTSNNDDADEVLETRLNDCVVLSGSRKGSREAGGTVAEVFA